MGRNPDELVADNARLRAEVQGIQSDLAQADEMIARTRRERDQVRADLKLACVWLRDFDGDWSLIGIERELRAWTDAAVRSRPTGDRVRVGGDARQARSEVKRLEDVIDDLRRVHSAEIRRLAEELDAVNQQAWLPVIESITREQIEIEDETGVVRTGFLFFSKREVMVDGVPLVLLSGLMAV